MKRVLFWGAVLIGGYLVLINASGAVSDANAAGTNSVNLIKAFQGR